MKLKLPPKLKSPYSYAEWLDLEYTKDPKFTKTLKFLNLTLIKIKKTKPLTVELFEEFREHVAYLMKRIKKMLGDSKMPEEVREFIEPFFILLKKWQKGAVKVQDLLIEESDEEVAAVTAASKNLQQNAALAAACLKDYTLLAQTVDKSLKDITKLDTIVGKGVASPKLTSAVNQVRAGKLQASLAATQAKCARAGGKLADAREIARMAASAKAQGNRELADQCVKLTAQIQSIEKTSKAVDAGIAKYDAIAKKLLKAFDARAKA
ncbi:hypothetical protein M2447_000651 [Ereboglobus sp. PH5-10]|uniref:hypothetical protein n=1 Tax=Ereboglobus sp. PH5-10 TaxID=2940629 RepID=UPI002405ACAE|nr:hypothetical protein [Ereboglobus sp. PH5-10]MDF9826570.1 hypothetical protein [Ereboglobus sp. PH5-10]